MLTLCIDTSCNTAGVSICENGIIISEISINDRNTHSVKLMPAVDYLFKIAGKDVSDLDLIAVVNGPGSYTGLRIGVSAAKAISYSADVPVVGVNTLDFLAYSAACADDGYICPVIDARNTHMYFALYNIQKDGCVRKTERIIEYGAMPADEMCEVVKSKTQSPVLFIGDGVIANRELLKQLFGENFIEADSYQVLGRVSFAAKIAEDIYQSKKDIEDFSAEALDVYYLRTPRISAPKKRV
ncbi:MAG: tRNA (adenosine(37)-N6)-threonylcarbamoyltransferase complex dimerization subunit type 1 TsaB [Clostridia bacterium]|nr:tRNA (adenosine(37)-N6)-threonylcarbamoyltransferase complex dimerization subunit type 1 TsaB [Clostridia bacterium]